MRRPGMRFLYRLECTIAPEEINIGAPHGAGIIRSIANITGGTFKGPGLEGTVLALGGADWATVIEGTHVSLEPLISLLPGFYSGIMLTKQPVHDPRRAIHDQDN
jgi:hypothetical protein